MGPSPLPNNTTDKYDIIIVWLVGEDPRVNDIGVGGGGGGGGWRETR